MGSNGNLRVQRAMHRTFVGDFHQPRPLRVAEITGNFDFAVDLIYLSFSGFAVRAVIRMDFVVP